MQQPGDQDGDTGDVLSLGEDSDPRWGRAGAVVLVLVLALGAYRVVSEPETPAAPPAAAQDRPSLSVVDQPPPWVTDDLRSGGTTVRLGGRVVTLHGPEVATSSRGTSATSLGPLPAGGWLVRVTTTCDDSGARTASYGSARRSGRFTPWDPSDTRPRRTWLSPDRRLVLFIDGGDVVVRRTTGMSLSEFRAASSS